MCHLYTHYAPNSPTNAGKLATKDGEEVSRCKMIVRTELVRSRRKSIARRRARAALDWPSTRRSSEEAKRIAHSRWIAALSTDDTTATRSSIVIVCSGGCCMSALAIIDGKERNRNMGKMGGIVASCGKVNTNVAIRLQPSSSPRLGGNREQYDKGYCSSGDRAA